MAYQKKFVPKLFKWRHFQPDIILLCVRWYLSYRLSYRDLVEMMDERGLKIAHTTIMRWVFKFSFALKERVRPQLRRCSKSWRMDETYISILNDGFGPVDKKRRKNNMSKRLAEEILEGCANRK